MLKRSYRTVLLACLAVGCNDVTSAPGRLGNGDELRPAFAARVLTVSVKPASSTINVGQTVQLTASSKPAKKAMYVWSTSNSAVAKVSATGLVTGLAAGTATITATSEGKSGTASVTVSAAPPGGTSVTLVGAGDIASCSSSGDEATAALVDTMPGTVFTAGDNAYSDGSAVSRTRCSKANPRSRWEPASDGSRATAAWSRAISDMVDDAVVAGSVGWVAPGSSVAAREARAAAGGADGVDRGDGEEGEADAQPATTRTIVMGSVRRRVRRVMAGIRTRPRRG